MIRLEMIPRHDSKKTKNTLIYGEQKRVRVITAIFVFSLLSSGDHQQDLRFVFVVDPDDCPHDCGVTTSGELQPPPCFI